MGKRTGSKSKLEVFCKSMLLGAKIDMEEEFRFHDKRKWRFDFADPFNKIAIELDGGNWLVRNTKSGKPIPVGRHTQKADREKLNTARSMGWTVFQYGSVEEIADFKKHYRECIASKKEIVTKMFVEEAMNRAGL